MGRGSCAQPLQRRAPGVMPRHSNASRHMRESASAGAPTLQLCDRSPEARRACSFSFFWWLYTCCRLGHGQAAEFPVLATKSRRVLAMQLPACPASHQLRASHTGPPSNLTAPNPLRPRPQPHQHPCHCTPHPPPAALPLPQPHTPHPPPPATPRPSDPDVQEEDGRDRAQAVCAAAQARQ